MSQAVSRGSPPHPVEGRLGVATFAARFGDLARRLGRGLLRALQFGGEAFDPLLELVLPSARPLERILGVLQSPLGLLSLLLVGAAVGRGARRLIGVLAVDHGEYAA